MVYTKKPKAVKKKAVKKKKKPKRKKRTVLRSQPTTPAYELKATAGGSAAGDIGSHRLNNLAMPKIPKIRA